MTGSLLLKLMGQGAVYIRALESLGDDKWWWWYWLDDSCLGNWGLFCVWYIIYHSNNCNISRAKYVELKKCLYSRHVSIAVMYFRVCIYILFFSLWVASRDGKLYGKTDFGTLFCNMKASYNELSWASLSLHIIYLSRVLWFTACRGSRIFNVRNIAKV